ncbi:MAG: ATP-binding protein, partial [Flavobacterium sp.]
DLLKQGWKRPIKEEIYLKVQPSIMTPVLLSANTFESDNMVLLSVILTDVTHRNKQQEELKRNASQLEQKNTELEKLNQELAFQNEEKEKRAAELLIANKELVFQSEEKEKRAAELFIADKELLFQTEEKKKVKQKLNLAKTDVKELEELIAHKESILAILSHDLRSPLAGIIGIAEYLQSNFEEMDTEKVKEMLVLLHESSKNELNMLDYLVEWARIKYASQVFSPEKIELSQYVKKIFDLLNESASQNEIELHNEVEMGIRVFADEKMLLSILQNILTNAIKHSFPCETVTVSAERKADKIIVQIKDTGIGMSKEIREKLFIPQMDSLTHERIENKGAGIGLLLVKGFLEKNGGEIWVESTEGKGSSFYFTLPIEKSTN